VKSRIEEQTDTKQQRLTKCLSRWRHTFNARLLSTSRICVYRAVCNWSKYRHHIEVAVMNQLTVFGEILWNILLENLYIWIFTKNITTTTTAKQPVSRQVHNVFQNEFSGSRDLVLTLSNSNIVCFLKVIHYLLTSSSSSFRPFSVFSLIICFRRQFLRKIWTIQLAFLRFIVRVSSMTFCNTSLFLQPLSNLFFVSSPYCKTFTVCMAYYPKCQVSLEKYKYLKENNIIVATVRKVQNVINVN
jgi:hypothetical protein